MDTSVRARIDKSVSRLGGGNFSGVKSEGEGVSALRLDFGPGYRVYFGQDGRRLVILLAGGTKRRQDDDIQRAFVVGRVQEAQASRAKGGERCH
jgi:putative addiction module killer protein